MRDNGTIILAEAELKSLYPDSSWDVAGLRDFVGGIVAVALVASVGLILVGCMSMVAEHTIMGTGARFSWKRLLAALLVPLVIGAATSGWGWSRDAFGTSGLSTTRSSYTTPSAAATDISGNKGLIQSVVEGAKKLYEKAKDTAQKAGSWIKDKADKVWNWGKDTVSGLVSGAQNAWNWVTGGAGKGNVIDKAKNLGSSIWNWATGKK